MQIAPGLDRRLADLERVITERGAELALFLVYDRPERAAERPGLARTFFAQRCVSDAQLEQTIGAFRSIGAYVELFEGERPLLAALTDGRLAGIDRRFKVVYNGIEGGIATDGFEPGRKALIPAVADSFNLVCSNSNAYACALGRHKFHYFTVLRSLGVSTPAVWHYRPDIGWAGGRAPQPGTKVIAKSTYESWSVGVTDESVFVVDSDYEERVADIAERIGQAVTVQEFVSGPEICVPIVAFPDRVVAPPVEAVLAKAPGDRDAVMTVDDNLAYRGVTYRVYDDTPEVMDQLHSVALETFAVLELRSFARVDFRVDATGQAWVIDVGVSPGLSTGSSAFHSFAALGFDHPSFLRVVVGATLGARGLLS